MTKKAPQSKCNYEVINMLENQLQSFSIHQQRNIVQLHRFKHQKENLGDGEVIISEDFRENYSLKHQNEIMSARWTQEQVSLLCAAVYYSKDEVKKHQHYVLCSTRTVFIFIINTSLTIWKKRRLLLRMFIIGLMGHLASLRTHSFSQTFVSWAGWSSKSWLEFLCDCPWKRCKRWCRWWRKNSGSAQDLATEGSCHKLWGISVCCKEKFPWLFGCFRPKRIC